ncbi:MAG: GAF domain-containing protein [Desulfobacterales bacterium]|nr:GAF domain-containing protein [Desulfobacterales bacterium]
MSTDPDSASMQDRPLYNSHIIRTFAEYLSQHHPEIDIAPILRDAGMTSYELEDEGHWFSQRQVDRFYESLAKKTDDPDIPRKAGRYAASSQASGAIRQYVMGFMSPASAYRMLERIASNMSRAFVLETNQVAGQKMEITVRPKPGVNMKPYQCENTIGMLESMAKLFTNKFAKVEHPVCLHRGGGVCRYKISWEENLSFHLRRIRNYAAAGSVPAVCALYFVLPPISLLAFIFSCGLLILGVSLFFEQTEKREFVRNIQSQGNAANELLNQINIRYNNALLIKEIGEAMSKVTNIDELLRSVVDAMKKRLDFDRGGIWMADEKKTALTYKVGYGYDREVDILLQHTRFVLDNPGSRGMAVLAFKEQKPFLVNDVREVEKDLSDKSVAFVHQIGARSFICVPISYEGESFGVLFVDNVKSKRPLSQSDMAMLMGIAPQVAISIQNALSYQRIQESREREQILRKLFEKYVPAPVIKKYADGGEVDLFKGEELPISVMFLDIRDFTARSESMDPRDVVDFLNEYFEKCAEIISEKNGHINKYTGDGFLAVFGAPEPSEGHPCAAFEAACKIYDISGRYLLGGRPLEIGVGLAVGNAILGNIGSQSKIEYTAIGATVNTAARLEGVTKRFPRCPIIMGKETWLALSGHPLCGGLRHLGKQRVRGKTEAIELFGYSPGCRIESGSISAKAV